MLLSYQWLTELVELPEGISQHDVAEHLTLAGLEVEGASGDVLELKITPNRPDALSHVGVARELSAILQTRTKISKPSVKELSGPVHDVVQVQIADRTACPRYACRVIEGVTVQESPEWLRTRLIACGIRPINNVVDVTNWVLLERGHPLHAFDFECLAKDRTRATLWVRFAQKGEKLTTLDGKERSLGETDLVIADGKVPVALAGVMGGRDTEVTAQSTTILLESAYFAPSVIRQQARRHGLSTEASYRFERGADPNAVLSSLDRAAQMIAELAGGRVRREAIDVYPTPILPLEISVRRRKLVEVSGLSEEYLKDTAIRDAFLKLGIETVGRLGGDAMSFRVPTFRPDITREIDLIEEAMRLIGYDKVPKRLLFTRAQGNRGDESLGQTVDRVRDALRAAGFDEAINFSFGSPSQFARFHPEPKVPFIQVQNPLGEELSLMRQSLLPGLVENVSLNIRQGAERVSLFETGQVFLGPSEHGRAPNRDILAQNPNHDAWANERLYLAGVLFGKLGAEAFDVKKRPADYYDLKGVLQECFLSLRVEATFRRPKQVVSYLHPGESAEIVVAGTVVGVLGRLDPQILDAFAFEIDLQLLAPLGRDYEVMKPIAKFPSVKRDMALLLNDDMSADQVMSEIRRYKAFSGWLQAVRVFDVYKGDKLPAGKKSLAISLELRSPDRTLTDDEIASGMKALVSELENSLGAQIR